MGRSFEESSWELGISAAILLTAMAVPWVLHPANRLWMRFGQLLHRIVTPVILALVFVSTVVPTALVMRLMGKDPTRRKFDPQVGSYWIKRQADEPAPRRRKNALPAASGMPVFPTTRSRSVWSAPVSVWKRSISSPFTTSRSLSSNAFWKPI